MDDPATRALLPWLEYAEEARSVHAMYLDMLHAATDDPADSDYTANGDDDSGEDPRASDEMDVLQWYARMKPPPSRHGLAFRLDDAFVDYFGAPLRDASSTSLATSRSALKRERRKARHGGYKK